MPCSRIRPRRRPISVSTAFNPGCRSREGSRRGSVARARAISTTRWRPKGRAELTQSASPGNPRTKDSRLFRMSVPPGASQGEAALMTRPGRGALPPYVLETSSFESHVLKGSAIPALRHLVGRVPHVSPSKRMEPPSGVDSGDRLKRSSYPAPLGRYPLICPERTEKLTSWTDGSAEVLGEPFSSEEHCRHRPPPIPSPRMPRRKTSTFCEIQEAPGQASGRKIITTMRMNPKIRSRSRERRPGPPGAR